MAKIPNEKPKAIHEEKIEKLTEEATKYLSKQEAYFKKILEDIDQTLNQIVCKKGWTIHGRVKSIESLREKIIRKEYYKICDSGVAVIDQLPDLIGVRVQCLLNQEEKIAYELLQNKRTSLDEMGFSFYQTKANAKMSLFLRNQPEKQKNGHDIYRIEGRYYAQKNLSPVHFELQIKSMVHSFWGELEHSMFYKNYDYFISHKILTQSMDNILTELDLIDKEMEGLQNNFTRDKTDRINEFKSVCVSVIQKEYQSKFNELYECEIDLRAAYWLIVEIRFNKTNNEEQAAEELGQMIQRCKNVNLSNALEMVTVKLDADNIGPNIRQCAEWLDKLVKESVYWEAFFCIYVMLKQDKDYEYKDWIEDIVKHLLHLKILKHFTADFLDEAFCQSIQHALIFESNGKLEYFMEEKKLEFIQERISEALKGSVFEKYQQGSGQKQFDKKCALKSIFLWTKCLIDFIVNEYIMRETFEKLIECLDKENIFSDILDIEGEQILQCFDDADKLSGQKAKEIGKKLFVWEDIK